MGPVDVRVTPMKPEVKAEWLEALRSGEYQQGQNYLRSEGTYCCLGVLCEIAAKHGVIEPPKPRWEEEGWDGPIAYGAEMETGLLPDEVIEWSGVSRHGLYTRGGQTLASLNDSGVTFDKIADKIERWL